MRSKGILSFYNDCGDGKVRCNGSGKQGKDALSVCAQSFKHGCLKSATLSRYARMHKDSHLCRCMMQRRKWLSLQDAATLMADEARMRNQKSAHRPSPYEKRIG